MATASWRTRGKTRNTAPTIIQRAGALPAAVAAAEKVAARQSGSASDADTGTSARRASAASTHGACAPLGESTQ